MLAAFPIKIHVIANFPSPNKALRICCLALLMLQFQLE
jgi:hypothetical protein